MIVGATFFVVAVVSIQEDHVLVISSEWPGCHSIHLNYVRPGPACLHDLAIILCKDSQRKCLIKGMIDEYPIIRVEPPINAIALAL
jgi:hypothetical protein